MAGCHPKSPIQERSASPASTLATGRAPRAGEGDLPTGLSLADLANHAGLMLVWVAAILTALTGWDYFRKALPFLREGKDA